jgi:hypothetical protein
MDMYGIIMYCWKLPLQVGGYGAHKVLIINVDLAWIS